MLCDGAMGTMLYARGVFINKCYDELNLSQPEMVRAVHAEYLQAGAEVVETNTFGANAFRLQRYGFRDKVHDINVAGVKLARECAIQIAEKQGTESFVAGSIGPLGVRLEPLGKIGLDEAEAAFAEQIRALVEGGPGVGADLLIVIRRGHGRLVDDTIPDPRQNSRAGVINGTPDGVGIGAQHGQQQPLGGGGVAGPGSGAQTQAEIGGVDDEFVVYQGGVERPLDGAPAWRWVRKDGLHPHDVPAVAEFRKAVAEADKALAAAQAGKKP